MPLLRNDCVLDIVGTGPMRPVLERRARELGIMDRVVFHQEMPRRDLLQMYLNADVFVLLSKYEAYSMAVAEALTAGTPCIVAKASALTEWIDDKCCFGIDYPIKKEVLAELINSVLAIRNSTQKCATASKKIKGWNEVVKQLEDVYEG
jgi:glycosyltransferase involved in cell wall biosynthesis